MRFPVKILEFELSEVNSLVSNIASYQYAKILIKLYRNPIGYIDFEINNEMINQEEVIKKISDKYHLKILSILCENFLREKLNYNRLDLIEILKHAPKFNFPYIPLISVIVCSRNRTNDLKNCLFSILNLNYDNFEVIIVDNSPDDDSTKLLVNQLFPKFKYTVEPRPGLNWARNKGILESNGDIIVYADDDVVVDKNWLRFIAYSFIDKNVMGVTGLVAPLELETEAQVQFEEYGGFGKGFERKEYEFRQHVLPWGILGTGQLGTGANMAFRKAIFKKIGYFDPALDVGTVTNGGGDLEFFFRLLKYGYKHVYEPCALVWHKHRVDYHQLKIQISNNSKGLVSYFKKSRDSFPEQKIEFFKIWYWYLKHWIFNRLLKSYFKTNKIPRELILAELPGLFRFSLYKLAKRHAIAIDKNLYYSYLGDLTFKSISSFGKPNTNDTNLNIQIVNIDISEPIHDILNLKDFFKVKFFVFQSKELIGSFDFINNHCDITKDQLIPQCSKSYANYLINKNKEGVLHLFYDFFYHKKIFTNNFETSNNSSINKYKISIVIATYDRPQDLKECLFSLMNQETIHDLEIIVIDNNPSSKLTPPILKQFPNVFLTNEPIKGLSIARNRGIRLSKGKIILTTDDDVICPPNWVEKISEPFIMNQDIMIVTGNVLPFQLKNSAQQFFEIYGGLGRGFKRQVANKIWFDSFKKMAVPTWSLGACANAAFRSMIFHNEKIGILDETLGAGTPTGCSEDTYIFYKTLNEGYTIIYEPSAFVWHKHRNTIKAFKKQIYNYSKGHIAYNIKTWWNHNDHRGLWRIFYEIPVMQYHRIRFRIFRKTNYSLSFVLLETIGYIIGPFSLIHSWFIINLYNKYKYKK